MKTMCCDTQATEAGTHTSGRCFYPKTDIAEFDDHFSIEVELPGVTADQVDLQVEDDILRLTAKRGAPEAETEATTNHLVRERRRGTYVRTFHLGTLVERDGIQGNLKDGVLTIRLAKAVNALPRKIAIQ
jgi:HSP20 family protein